MQVDMKEEGSRQGAKSAKTGNPSRLGEFGAFALLAFVYLHLNLMPNPQ